MQNVADIFGHVLDPRTFKPSDNLLDPYVKIGLEIELENFHAPHNFPLYKNPFWDNIEDESLRGRAVELRFKYPLTGNDVITAITSMSNNISLLKDIPTTSDRTSTHVHIDANDITSTQLYNWIILYILFEKVLYNYVGSKRKRSVFCVPFYISNSDLHVLNTLVTEIDIKDSLYRKFNERFRYSGLNLNSLFKFGSLEFRMLDGEWKKNKLLLWLNILIAIRTFSINMKSSLEDYVERVLTGNAEEELHKVFGDIHEILLYKNLENDLIDGARLVQKIMKHASDMKLSWEILRFSKNIKLKEDYRNIFKKRNPIFQPKNNLSISDDMSEFTEEEEI